MHTLMFDGVISCGSVLTRDLRSIPPVGFPSGPFADFIKFFFVCGFLNRPCQRVFCVFFFIKRSVFASTL